MKKQPRYMDLMDPSVFIKIFGDEANKDLLLSFLNAMFEGRKDIRDVQCSEIIPKCKEKGIMGASMRFVCTNETGEQFLVDLQLPDRENFPD